MSGSYLKSLQLAKQLEEKTKEAAKNKDIAEKEYESLDQFLKSCKEIDADLSSVEKPKRDFEAAMASKDYQSAIANIKKAREAAKNAYISKIGEVGDSVEILLTLIQGSGSESKSASELLEKSKERVVADDLEGAMKYARSAYDAAERTVHEVFSQLFSQAQETIMQAKDFGDDVTIFEDQLARAKSALENQEYDSCMEQIKEVLEGAGEDLNSQVSASISRAEEVISAGEELGADVTRVKTHVDRSKSALAALKYKEALSYAKKAEVEGENALSARFQELVREVRDSIKKMKNAKEDVTVPQQLLDQAQAALKEKKYIEALHALNTANEKVHKAEFESVLEVIQAARDRFVLAKKVGVDMTKAIMLLNTSRDNLKLGKYEEAIRYAEQSRKEIDSALEMFYKARDQIVELSKAVKFAADVGSDPTAARDLLTEARKCFEAKDYAQTIEITSKGLAVVKKLTHDSTMEAVNASDRAVKFGKGIGADMTEAEGLLHRALDSVAKEDLADAAKLAGESKGAANAAVTRLMSDKLQSLDQFIGGYSGDQPITDIGESIAQARQFLASYEFERAYESIKHVTDRIEDIGQAECERQVTVAKSKIDLVRTMGGDVSDLEILLTRANEAISKKAYDDATARAREITEHANEAMVKLLQTGLSEIRDYLDEARNIGIDVEDAKVRLKDVRSKTDAQEFGEAFELVKQTKSSLQKEISRYDGIKSKIRHAEELIAEGSRTKADISAQTRKFENARNAFANGDLENADRLLDEVTKESEKTLAMYLAARFILSSKESIELAKANSVDTDASDALLSKAKDLMKQKNYEEALEVAKKCDAETKSALGSAITEMIRDLQRLLVDAKNVGVDTAGPEKLAEKATALAKTEEYAEALKCISSAKEDINHVKNLSSQAAIEIRTARTNLKNAETLDMDVGKAREFLDQAVEALTRHQYAIALELARKSSAASSEIARARIWGTLEDFKKRLDKEKAEGVNVETAEACVADGIRAFKDGKYQDALKLAMKCEAEMERAELQRDISTRAVELARKKMAEASAEGIKSQRLNDLVTEAERLLAEGNYVDAMTAAMESGDELHAIRENLDSCRIELSATRERIERLKKVRIDTRECDEIIDMAQEYLAAQDFARCRDALRRASVKAAALFENSIRDVMEQNRTMIEKAKVMGINTKSSEDLLEVANTSFKEKLWDFAFQQAMACRDGCLQMISKKLSNLVSDVQLRIAALKRLGASVRPLEEMVHDAQSVAEAGDIGTAFEILMDADRRIVTVEESHRKYMDISIAAESAIESLSRFGMSKREPERLMAMAEIEREKDYDSAIELVAEALDTAREQMESYSPELSGTLAAKGMQVGSESDLVLTIKNSGRAMAKDITIDVSGEYDVVQVQSIQTLKPDSEVAAKLRLVPKREGSVPIKLLVKCKRHFDGKPLTFEISDTPNVFPGGPSYKIGRAGDMARCISCQGRIKQGFDIVTCRCGGQLHLSCAKRNNQCPICGQKYSF